MKKVKLYPTRHGLIVRDPRTKKPLSEDGELKEKSGYWLRRLRDGSVSEKPLPPLKAAAKSDKPETAK
ncbi:DUF2635 domain-containing protein [Salmonella enterica]|nr:DUF2635 domain-containing protein [Salmonella enterica]